MKTFFSFGAVLVLSQVLACSASKATTLSELIETSILSHPSIRAQQARERAAHGEMSAAKWQYFPTPSIGVERVATSTQSASYSNGDSSVTTVRLQQPIWSGGRLSAGVQKAQAAVMLASVEVDVARQELALRIIQAYAEWHGGVFKELAYEKSLQSHRRLQQQTVRRINEGVSPQADLSLVLGRIEQTQGELIVAQAQQLAALSRLTQMLGRDVRANALMQFLAKPMAVDAVQDMVQWAQAGSPGVARLVATARVQQSVIDERRADLSPEVYMRMERQHGNFFSRGAPPENRVFFALSTRFGAGLSTLSAVDVARGRYEAALADIDSARVTLSDQVYADHVQVESGSSRLLSLNASLSSAQATAQAWGRQFLSGQKSWLDVMNSVREIAQVESQIADVNASQLLLTWRLNLLTRGVNSLIARATMLAPVADKGAVPVAPAARLPLLISGNERAVVPAQMAVDTHKK